MNWRWIIAVALLAALSAGYSAFLRRDIATVVSNEPLQQPGYYLNDAVVTQSKADGSPGITLVAKHIEQQQQQDTITLSDVQVDYAQAPGRRWTLNARRATVPPDSRIVEFTGSVELRPEQTAQRIYLRTEALTVDTEKNFAYSNNSPVEVRVGVHALTARAIEVDLARERVRLRAIDGRATPAPASAGGRRE